MVQGSLLPCNSPMGVNFSKPRMGPYAWNGSNWYIRVKEIMQFKAMTKSKSNKDVFQNKVAKYAGEDVTLSPICTFQYF